ncbi:DUF1707 domain-containing protein [Streptomyces sp. NPDC048639]|uniref:DUF1707 SHOCT-like domain-containing protein n=1 Tax=Streptomyces sp. NPDC048639 TaxID=3365581 RepID=UPI003723E1BA
MSERPDLPELRASDADRDRVAEILREAVAEGRLDMEEFDERLGAAYRARTYADLEPLTRDLPVAGGAAVGEPATVSADWQERIGGPASSTKGIAVMSGFQRKGRWTVPRRFTAFTFWGGGELDLREARFEDREVEIRCFTIMGGVQIVVPPGVEVDVRGFGVMGGFDQSAAEEPGERGAPRVVVSGFAFWGGVAVERKLARAERRRLKAERQEWRELERERELEEREQRRRGRKELE